MSEISGIIKNASERGWAINEIKQSLVNAGYPPQDIDFEISRSSSNYQESSMPQAEQTLSSLSPKNLSNLLGTIRSQGADRHLESGWPAGR